MDTAAGLEHGDTSAAALGIVRVYEGRTRELRKAGVDFKEVTGDLAQTAKNAMTALEQQFHGAWNGGWEGIRRRRFVCFSTRSRKK